MNKKIKLLLATEAALTGTRRNLLDIASTLDLNNFEITICYSSKRADAAFLDCISSLREKGLRIERIDLKREISPIHDLIGFIRYFKLIRRNKYDIVHVHSSKAGFIGRLAAWLAGIRVIIYTPHGISFFQEHSRILNRVYYLAEKLALMFTDVVIAVSAREAMRLLESGFLARDKMELVPTGVNASLFLENGFDKSSLCVGIPDDFKIVGTVSRFSAKKGPEYFFKAASIILREMEKVKFIFVGDGELRREIEKLIEDLGIQHSVILFGDQKDTRPFYKMMNVFVLSSIVDERPYVVMEAMAAGIPVVSTNVIDPELIDHELSGLLVPPANEKALADAVLRLLADNRLADIVKENGKQKVVKQFEITSMTRRTEYLYYRLVGK